MNDKSPAALPRRRPVSLGQEVMNDLVAKIRHGVYKPGGKLPTEPEIMAAQGVSRTVVREAISRLQAAGFVETRHGVGTFVLQAAASSAPALDAYTVVTIRDVLAMLELRISLETEAAGLAALRRSDDQLAQMRRALEVFDHSVDQGGIGVDTDFQFHLLIAQATGNKYFEDFCRHLGTTTIPRNRLNTAQLAHESAPDYLRQVSHEHRSIVDAIDSQDAKAARAAMRMHLTDSRERLRRASGEIVA